MDALVNTYRGGDKDTRPWGDWAVVDVGPGFCVKRIRVAPGGILSLQRHRHRAEHWVITAGLARVTRDGAVFDLAAGETVFLPQGCIHRVTNPGDQDLVFIEVQTGTQLREDDIERLEDHYNRR